MIKKISILLLIAVLIVGCKKEVKEKETNLKIERLIELDAVIFDKGLAVIVSDRVYILCELENVDTEKYLKELENKVREYAQKNNLPSYVIIG